MFCIEARQRRPSYHIGGLLKNRSFGNRSFWTALRPRRAGWGSGECAAGDPAHRYLWGQAVDQILADETVGPGGDGVAGTADDVAWLLTDQQNSVRDVVTLDDGGTPGNPADDHWQLATHVAYDSYGNVTPASAAADCLFAWTGRLRDAATGLQQNGNRWYDPAAGRWMSEDPIGFEGGDANLRRYCGNDGVNAVDWTGLVDGHHIVPECIWRWTGLDPKISEEIFGAKDARVFPPKGAGHNFTAHGAKEGYIAEVKKLMITEWQKYKRQHNIVGMGTLEQQKAFAQHIVKVIDDMPTSSFIGGFNDAVKRGGTAAVKEWRDSLAKSAIKRAREAYDDLGSKMKKGMVALGVLGYAEGFYHIAENMVYESDEVRRAKLRFMAEYRAAYSKRLHGGTMNAEDRRHLFDALAEWWKTMGFDTTWLEYAFTMGNMGH